MPTQASLPTFDKLRSKVPADVDVKVVAEKWLESFAEHVISADIAGVIDLFVDDAFFRDILALTWDFRTFEGTHAIKKFLEDRLPEAKPTSFKLKDGYLGLQQLYPDVAWIQGLFEFETNIGLGSGVFRLVPLPDGDWKAHTVFTSLDDLKAFPEKIGSLREYEVNDDNWSEKRKREVEFEDAEPTVLIVGGGQGGLSVAARLKNLNVTSLIVERQPRVGDQWRKRYQSLCLHDPVCECSFKSQCWDPVN
jgi:NAD(P)-binding Rossmann-like domain